jgi:hypothetical protein
MARRIRYAMEMLPMGVKLSGIVEAHETYVGGKSKNMHQGRRVEPHHSADFDYRYGNRKARDGARTENAIRLPAGKRLMYEDSCAHAEDMMRPPHALDR